MKSLFIAMTLVFASSAFAETATQFTCKAGTTSGTVVTVKGCINDEIPELMSACPGEDSEYLTITRETPVAKQTPDLVETVVIPGRITTFSINTEEEFSLSISYELKAKNQSFQLEFTGGENTVNKMEVGVFSSPNSFKVVGCDFETVVVEF